ncbi:flagellar brake protein [Pontibacter sp. JAM-7]|uniref:flagellar brake protein n=1 Tax=Pontibacter sp. JAM-7 TaxID=3366581 RepID=UPI003AF9CE2D
MPHSLTSQSLRTLAELDPRPGARVQIETRSPSGRYQTTLIGMRESASLIVAAPRSGLAINEGARLTARLMSGNFIAAFSSRLLKIAAQPYGYWHLEYPQQVEVRRLRRHTRVPVNLVISVDPYEEQTTPQMHWPVTGYCNDLSVKGASVSTPTALGKVNDRLLLTFRLRVSDIDQVILIAAQIRNLQPQSGSVSSVVQHGLEFVDLDEDTRLMLTAFVYQQFLLETGHLDILNTEEA